MLKNFKLCGFWCQSIIMFIIIAFVLNGAVHWWASTRDENGFTYKMLYNNNGDISSKHQLVHVIASIISLGITIVL